LASATARPPPPTPPPRGGLPAPHRDTAVIAASAAARRSAPVGLSSSRAHVTAATSGLHTTDNDDADPTLDYRSVCCRLVQLFTAQQQDNKAMAAKRHVPPISTTSGDRMAALTSGFDFQHAVSF